MSIPGEKISVSINLVVHNGEKYIRQCLDSVFAQTYPQELVEINVLDNCSTDLTVQKINNWKLEIVNWKFGFNFVQSKLNLGMWPGQELLLEHSRGKYVVVLSVDVILHPDFIKNTVEVMEQDERVGAVQAKIYRGELRMTNNELGIERTNIIDTLGFKIYKSRRIVNIGHGELETRDKRQETSAEVFAVEGAVPVFRREALEDCRLESQDDSRSIEKGKTALGLHYDRSNIQVPKVVGKGRIVDPDFFWYGDDLDLAWRMRMFGWKEVYAPNVIAWHDRKTTKALAGGWREFIKIRKTVPLFKRRLDWRNTTLTIIKNDFAINWLRDLPFILWRQLRLWTYFIIFEPAMILEILNVAKMLPRMLKRRREIMKKAKVLPKDFRRWIN